MRRFLAVLFACALACAGVAHAETEEGGEQLKQFLASLHFQSGTIAVPEAGATLRLVPEYRYLGAKDAQKVLRNCGAIRRTAMCSASSFPRASAA